MSVKEIGEGFGPNSQPSRQNLHGSNQDTLTEIEARIHKQSEPIQLASGPGTFILVFLLFALLLIAIALQLRWHVSVIPADVQRDVRKVDDNLNELRNELTQRTSDRFHAHEFWDWVDDLQRRNPNLDVPIK